MWSDNESKEDLLRFNYLAEAVKAVVTDKELTPTTIGLFGDWGSGKSTLIKLLSGDLQKQTGVLCLDFNGWLFEGYEGARAALMGSILDSLKEHLKEDEGAATKAGKLLKKLFKRVDWFHTTVTGAKYVVPTLIGMPHLTVAAIVADATAKVASMPKKAADAAGELDPEEAKKFLKDSPEVTTEELRRGIREFRKDFAELLEESKLTTLVVFIDDLDRCLPDTVIDTLEAIRLFLFVPKTVFVIAADERLVEYAVRKRFPELPGTRAEVGRDYLEKMVQVPVRIPPLSPSDMEAYMNLLFAKKCLTPENYGKVCAHVSAFKPSVFESLSFDLTSARSILGNALDGVLQNDLDFIQQIAPVLTPGLGGSPRRVKRFLNTLLLRLAMGKHRGLDIKRQVMAKLMLLEYLKPEFFKDLARIQSAQDGKPKELADIENPKKEQKPEKTSPAGKGKGKVDIPESKSSATAEYQNWLADAWMKSWLELEPKLSDHDLRPYFYIAHDKIGVLAGTQARLSPVAQEILTKLLSPSEFIQGQGLRDAKTVSAPDALSIFEALAERIRHSESLEQSAVPGVLFKFVDGKDDLVPQLVSLYSSLPETKIPVSVVPLLKAAAENTPAREPMLGLLDRWSKSEVKPILKQAAKAHLGEPGK